MFEKSGEVFNIAKDTPPVAGCTVSKSVYCDGDDYIAYFSLAKGTDISTESYRYHKLMLVSDGAMGVYGCKNSWVLDKGECVITPTNAPIGVRTKTESVYTEISIRRNTVNDAVNIGEVFKLSELVPYQDGKIINMDVASNDKMKFVVMSFDKGTGLAKHAAPGEALIFALDGQGIIGYEGKEHIIRAGENFKFAKNGRHYVKADGRFKMALLLTLE